MSAREELRRHLGDGVAAVGFRAERFVAELHRRALEQGLLDVAYGTLDTPLGTLLVAVTERGVVRVAYPDEGTERVLTELAARVSPRVLAAPERTDAVRRELEDYFAGERRVFAVPVDWSLVHGFATRILHATARLPYGATSTYGRVAAEAGSPRAARAAGNALGSNPIPIIVPCHRVLHADGGLGGYSGGLDRKRYLLRLEGSFPADLAVRRPLGGGHSAAATRRRPPGDRPSMG
jgi:methylated-DNA-[protein]-cysteine S-methyltransferase